MPAHGALGKDQRLVAGGFQPAADNFFRVPKAVNGRGIDPVDAEVEGASDGGDGFVVVLGTPCEFPVAAADGPCAKADGGEVKVRIAKRTKRLRNSRSRHHVLLDDRGRGWLQKTWRVQCARVALFGRIWHILVVFGAL